MSGELHLITIGASHYCETARWALERAGLKFRETKHVAIFHVFATAPLGEGTSCPKLVIMGGAGKSDQRIVLHQSTDIVKFADNNIQEEQDRLFPDDPELQKLVESWVSKFGNDLGPNVRLWAYTYLLHDKSSYRLMTQGVSKKQRRFARLLLPVIQLLIDQNMSVTKPGQREKSLAVVESVFKEVDEVLADGRSFICGDRFTAADLSFAALGSIIIAPQGSGAWQPPINESPEGMASTMLRLRNTAAGKHILKMYETQRHEFVHK
ncbi:unnamed protein product [Sphagnum balticum]